MPLISPMISAPIYALGLIGEDGGQHLVGTPAFAKGRCFDRRGADERVAEGDAARTFVRPYQLVALGRGEIVELVLAAARRFQHPDIPGTLQGRGQEDRPGRGREPHDPGGEQLLQALSERQHRRKRLPRRALRIAQRLRQLQQGERVASRRVQHPAPHPGIESGKPGPHQVVSRLVIQGLQLIFQQAAPVKVVFRAGPAGGQQPHPPAAEPSRHEAQHAGAPSGAMTPLNSRLCPRLGVGRV